ncbi:30S ribosomal protein S18 [Candidatus Babeliales bacterium]|nr:30S ribosomal protein S18 [Candidatus Babeliales bacterium]
MSKKAKLKISSRLLNKKVRRKNGFSRKKHCRFCGSVDQEHLIDYKSSHFLRGFLTERGKILPSRISGTCCFHQRRLSSVIKQARSMALLPYCAARF